MDNCMWAFSVDISKFGLLRFRRMMRCIRKLDGVKQFHMHFPKSLVVFENQNDAIRGMNSMAYDGYDVSDSVFEAMRYDKM